MAGRASKRKSDNETKTDKLTTPTGKKLRSSERLLQLSGSRGEKVANQDKELTPPVFVIEEDDSPAVRMATNGSSKPPPSAEEFKMMLRDGLANVAKKEQLDQMMNQIKSNSSALRSLERKVDNTNESNERRFRQLEDRIQSGGGGSSAAALTDSKKAAFDKARRSMRVWPIQGEDQDAMNAAFRDFAVDALMIPDTVVRNARITDLIRVRSSPVNNVYMEILVTFSDAGERDYYFSKAKNRASFRDPSGNPTAGVRIDVPPFLLPTFKLLSNHGYEIRSVHGRDTKRYVKFDDENLSLFLEVRLPNQTKWTRIKPDQARTYSEEKDRLEYQSIKRGLLRTSESDNPNLIPLGSRPSGVGGSALSTSSGNVNAPSRAEVQAERPRWKPPAREAPRLTLRPSTTGSP